MDDLKQFGEVNSTGKSRQGKRRLYCLFALIELHSIFRKMNLYLGSDI